MARKPFFRAFDGWWYAYSGSGTKRKQVKLVKGKSNEREAYQAYFRLMAEEPGVVPVNMVAATVCGRGVVVEGELAMNDNSGHSSISGWVDFVLFVEVGRLLPPIGPEPPIGPGVLDPRA